MAHKDIEWAFTVRDATPPVKAVLVALAHCRNSKTGRCFPSQKRLADMTSFSLATVKRSLDVLIESKAVAATPMFKGGYQTNTEYTFDYAVTSVGGGVTVTSSQGDILSDSAEVGVTMAPPSPQGEHPVIPTGIQPEVNTEIMLVPPEEPIHSIEEIFAEAYDGWPKKVDRKDALAKFKIALRKFRGHEQDLLDAIRDHGAAHAQFTPRQFTPSLAVWLNKERWDNDLPEPPEAERRRPTRTEQNLAFVAQLAADQNAQTRGIAS